METKETNEGKLTPKILKEINELFETFNGTPVNIHIKKDIKSLEIKAFNINEPGFYSFKTKEDAITFFDKIKTNITDVSILPDYNNNSIYWNKYNGSFNLCVIFLPFNFSAKRKIEDRGGYNSKANCTYKYNYLSFIEGGAKVIIVYNNKRVSIRDNVKFPAAYIKKIAKNPDIFTVFKIT
jgi:hypothetical protein